MEKEALQSAIRMLARREHSCFELQQKLIQKGFAEKIVETALQKLIQKNLISDERFAEMYVRSRAAKGYGPLKISNELKEKGVSQELITSYCKNFPDQQENVAKVRAKKFGAALPVNLNDRAKQIRYLQYKGFSWEAIKVLFKGSSFE